MLSTKSGPISSRAWVGKWEISDSRPSYSFCL